MVEEDFQIADAISTKRAQAIEITSNLLTAQKLLDRTHSKTPGVTKSYEILEAVTVGVIEEQTDPNAWIVGDLNRLLNGDSWTPFQLTESPTAPPMRSESTSIAE